MTSPVLSDRPAVLARLDAAWAYAAPCVAGVRQADLARPTPCDAYDVGSLLDHLAGSVERFVAALGGEPPQMADGPPTERFDALRDANLAAWAAADLDGVYELPLGHVPGSLVADLNVAEVVLHGWDVGRATGGRAAVPDALAGEVLAIGRMLLTDDLRGTALPRPSRSTTRRPVDRMVAFYGRHP